MQGKIHGELIKPLTQLVVHLGVEAIYKQQAKAQERYWQDWFLRHRAPVAAVVGEQRQEEEVQDKEEDVPQEANPLLADAAGEVETEEEVAAQPEGGDNDGLEQESGMKATEESNNGVADSTKAEGSVDQETPTPVAGEPRGGDEQQEQQAQSEQKVEQGSESGDRQKADSSPVAATSEAGPSRPQKKATQGSRKKAREERLREEQAKEAVRQEKEDLKNEKGRLEKELQGLNKILNNFCDNSEAIPNAISECEARLAAIEARLATMGGSFEPTAITAAAQYGVKGAIEECGATDPACNIGVQCALSQLTGFNEFRDGKNEPLLANDMIDHMVSSSNWEEIRAPNIEELPAVLRQVQALANEGHIIVPAWYNPTGPHGHVSLVVPGELSLSGPEYWNCYVPTTMETGKGNRSPSTKMSYGFGADTKETIRFFRYKGPINNK